LKEKEKEKKNSLRAAQFPSPAILFEAVVRLLLRIGLGWEKIWKLPTPFAKGFPLLFLVAIYVCRNFTLSCNHYVSMLPALSDPAIYYVYIGIGKFKVMA
jgi:hypothetical protein